MTLIYNNLFDIYATDIIFNIEFTTNLDMITFIFSAHTYEKSNDTFMTSLNMTSNNQFHVSCVDPNNRYQRDNRFCKYIALGW